MQGFTGTKYAWATHPVAIKQWRRFKESKIGEQATIGVTEDRCAHPRRDYFLSHRFRQPKRIASGVYTLRVDLEEVFTGRTTHANTEIMISE